MSDIVAILTLSLFVTGYCVGYVPFHVFFPVIVLNHFEGQFYGRHCQRDTDDDQFLLSHFSSMW